MQWFQPKYAPYYLNQNRFDPGTTVKAWHWDGRVNTWYTGSDVVLKTENGAAALMAGAALGFAGMLAF